MALFRIPSDATGYRKFKMAAVKPEVPIFQLLDKISTPFQRLTPIFGVHQLNGTIANPAGVTRSRLLKMAAAKTGSSYISGSRLYSNTVPTENPPFSGSSNWMTL